MYPVIGELPLCCGGVQDKLTVVGDIAIAESPVGGSGGVAAYAYEPIKNRRVDVITISKISFLNFVFLALSIFLVLHLDTPTTLPNHS